MKVDKETIEYVANLARLRLSEKEKEKLALDLESIISYVDKLNELDTSKIIPTDHVIPIKMFSETMRSEIHIQKTKCS